MIKAVIFDCFGVLCTDGWLPFKSKYLGNDLEELSELNRQSDAGYISYQQFLEGVSRITRMPLADVRQAIEDNVPNTAMFELVQELKGKYTIGMLSNAAENWLDELFTAEQIRLFDAVTLSCETGFIKPDLRAYEAAAKAVGAEPDECVLIDDQLRYCDGAEAVGMKAIHHQNMEDTKEQLKNLLSQYE